MDALEHQQRLLQRLSESTGFPHPAPSVDRVETHISTLLLVGDHAYKFKKPLDLGFLDFSTLERRRHFCAVELEINQALAAPVYLDIATVRGRPEAPYIDGSSDPGERDAAGQDPVLEYAVHMRRFDRDRQLDNLLASGGLPVTAMNALAMKVARFHETTDRAPPDSPYGTPERILAPMLANFEALEPSPERSAESSTEPATELGGRLQALKTWTRHTAARLEETCRERHDHGCVRSCHGDMHLGNMVYLSDRQDEDSLAIFDGIEFDPSLRWIDVASEIAFLTMDLQAREAPAHAHQALNIYLERRDDPGLLRLLPFYQVYRALVRAKVNAIHAREHGIDAQERADHEAQVEHYVTLAEALRTPGRPGLILMHGLAGSGKTRVSTAILQRLGAIRLRSDVERKRLLGLPPEARPSPAQQAKLYSPEGIHAVYQHLLARTKAVLELGRLVIVDATFLTREQRQPFSDLARRLDAGLAIVVCAADEATLEQRLRERHAPNRPAATRNASDADVAVLHGQQSRIEAPGPDEPAVTTDPQHPLDWAALDRLLNPGRAASGNR